MTTTAEQIPHDHDLLSHLKGAPLSVLLALWRDGATGRKTLIARTGWRKDTVSRALKMLVDMGLIERLHHRRWALAHNVDVRQVLGICGEGQERENRPMAGEERKERPPTPAEERNNGSSATEEEREMRLSASDQEQEERNYRPSEERNDGPSQERNYRPCQERNNRSLAGHKERKKRPCRQKELINRPFPPLEERKKRSTAAEGRKKRSSRGHSIHDHDSIHDHGMYVVVHKQKNEKEKNNIIHALHALSPPFDNAERWLNSTSPDLVQAWLDYLDRLPTVERLLIHNEAGFIRSRVTAGQAPPAPQLPALVPAGDAPPASTQRAQAPGRHSLNPRHWELAVKKKRANPPRPCTDCGRNYRDYSGRCLVCAGIAHI